MLSSNLYLSVDLGQPEEYPDLLTFADEVEAALLGAGMAELRRTRDVHLTLAFIGRKKEPSLERIDEAVKDVLAKLRPHIHDIWVDTDKGPEVFGHAIVVIIDGEKNEQGQLHLDVLARCLQCALEQIGIEASDYVAHLTIGRVNQRKMQGVGEVLSHLRPPAVRFTLDTLTFHRGQDHKPLTYQLYPKKV